jgi:hypothetical protein
MIDCSTWNILLVSLGTFARLWWNSRRASIAVLLRWAARGSWAFSTTAFTDLA